MLVGRPVPVAKNSVPRGDLGQAALQSEDSVFDNPSMSLPQSPTQRKPERDQTRCAVLTGTGRSAIAVIGLRGRRAAEIVEQCFHPAATRSLAAGQVRYGQWTGGNDSATAAESVVITPLTEGRFEIHCHGGRAAIDRIVGDLRSAGAIEVEGFQWQPDENRLIHEAHEALSGCLTARTAAVALDQLRGAMADWVQRWIKVLVAPQRVSGRPSSAEAATSWPADQDLDDFLDQLRDEANAILSYAPIGLHLTQPYRVVLTGPPNVGKSTLMNQIVGYDRSITHDEPGTTRDVLHADTVIDGLPIRLSDTAGMRESDEFVERAGIDRAAAAAEMAELLLAVGSPDSTTPLASLGRVPVTAELSDRERDPAPPVLKVFNKADLLPPNQPAPASALLTNALNGDGIPVLLHTIADRLAPQWPPPGQPVPITRRQVTLLEELKYSTDALGARAVLTEILAGS